jgi:hypothetical protein
VPTGGANHSELQATQLRVADLDQWRDSIFHYMRGMMQQQGRPTLADMCRLAGVSRAAYHRFWVDHAPREQDTELRAALQEIALLDRHYVYRRIHAALQREGWEVNHKRVLRLLREDNLLSKITCCHCGTDRLRGPWRARGTETYPNLAKGLSLTGVNQVWVAHSTYVRLREECIYVPIITFAD